MNSQLNPENLVRIRKGLPHGASKLVAERTGYSYSYVTDVRRGKLFNREIIEAFLIIYDEEMSKRRDLATKIAQTLA